MSESIPEPDTTIEDRLSLVTRLYNALIFETTPDPADLEQWTGPLMPGALSSEMRSLQAAKTKAEAEQAALEAQANG